NGKQRLSPRAWGGDQGESRGGSSVPDRSPARVTEADRDVCVGASARAARRCRGHLRRRVRASASVTRIYFFPSLAIPVDEGWRIEVHAWCCRLRSHRIVIPLVRKALGFERRRLTATEKQTCADRARWMFADNTRGHEISITAA